MILSTFPQLFTYGLVAPFVLRIVLGMFFVLMGLRRRKQNAAEWDTLWNAKKIGSLPLSPILAKIQIVIGIFIFVGLYTQISAILSIVFLAAEWHKRRHAGHLYFSEMWNYVFMMVIAVALLFLGAGLLAFDLPL